MWFVRRASGVTEDSSKGAMLLGEAITGIVAVALGVAEGLSGVGVAVAVEGISVDVGTSRGPGSGEQAESAPKTIRAQLIHFRIIPERSILIRQGE
jgi:hypothetical protein